MSRLPLILLVIFSACATVGRSPEGPPLGFYRFMDVNGQAPPVEFPAGSGAYLHGGSLALDAQSRFALRFTARSPGEAGAAESGPVGTFRAAGDSLFFTPDGADDRPPVRFRYQSAGDVLRLWDTTGNAWTYRREAPSP